MATGITMEGKGKPWSNCFFTTISSQCLLLERSYRDSLCICLHGDDFILAF